MKRRQRRAFTLVELLVVIAIIGILIALLLPAVQAAREAARRMQCTSNLKNLALAMHNYHDTNRHFPAGFDRNTATSSAANNRECWGWHAMLLPFIEQEALHDQLNVSSMTLQQVCASATSQTVVLMQTKLSIFVCPSDAGGSDLAHADRHFGGGVGTNAGGLGDWRPGITNYIGNRGVKDKPRDDGDTHGVLFFDSDMKMARISDGTSNTFCIGERSSLPGRAGAWIGVRNPNGDGSRGLWYNIGHSRSQLNAPTPPIGWSSDKGSGEGFSSDHPGGANFAFCDGSVHFLADTIEFGTGAPSGRSGQIWNDFSPGDSDYDWYYVYHRLSRRNDGFPVSIP